MRLVLVPPVPLPLPPSGWTMGVRRGERVALPVRHVEAAVERVAQSPELRRALLAGVVSR